MAGCREAASGTSGSRWATGQRTIPLNSGSQSVAVAGTTLALVFPGRLPPVKTAEVKKLLAPVLDFTRRSASETYMETLAA